MSVLPPDAFRGVRVFVTGHTGFKGAWLCEWLLGEDAILGGMALAPEGQASLFSDLGLAERMTSVIGDIREPAAVASTLVDFQPDIVFHLAAQAQVRASYADPVGTFSTNVMGTVHVLEAARRCGSVKALVCVTSDKCYENRGWVWGYREGDPLGGGDPYSASKAAAEVVATCYRQTILPLDGRVRLATARAGNVIGGGDWSPDRLVPDLVRAIDEKRPMVLRNPSALRPWQHVLEPLRGYLELGHGLLTSEALEGCWNFGPRRENEITVAEMVRLFTRAWSPTGKFEVRVEPSPLVEAQTLRLEISKAHALLDWRPALGIDETVQMTAQWYRQRQNSPAEVPDLTRVQIDRYKTVAATA